MLFLVDTCKKTTSRAASELNDANWAVAYSALKLPVLWFRVRYYPSPYSYFVSALTVLRSEPAAPVGFARL